MGSRRRICGWLAGFALLFAAGVAAAASLSWTVTFGPAHEGDAAVTLHAVAADSAGFVTWETTASCTSTCSTSVPDGARVELQAELDKPGWAFTGWSGDCSGQSSPCTFLSLGRPISSAANFRQYVVLTIIKDGYGGGTVGMTCPGVADYQSQFVAGFTGSDTYRPTPGCAVTLTADGSGFSGWSGDCSGTAQTCVVTMTGDRTVHATFCPCTQPTVNPPATSETTGTTPQTTTTPNATSPQVTTAPAPTPTTTTTTPPPTTTTTTPATTPRTTTTTATPTTRAPRLLRRPSVAGTAVVGGLLRATAPRWDSPAKSIRFGWHDCTGGPCVPIAGAHSRTLRLGRNLARHRVRVEVTALVDGTQLSASSPPILVAKR